MSRTIKTNLLEVLGETDLSDPIQTIRHHLELFI
jgi:hypothetical protein